MAHLVGSRSRFRVAGGFHPFGKLRSGPLSQVSGVRLANGKAHAAPETSYGPRNTFRQNAKSPWLLAMNATRPPETGGAKSSRMPAWPANDDSTPRQLADGGGCAEEDGAAMANAASAAARPVTRSARNRDIAFSSLCEVLCATVNPLPMEVKYLEKAKVISHPLI